MGGPTAFTVPWTAWGPPLGRCWPFCFYHCSTSGGFLGIGHPGSFGHPGHSAFLREKRGPARPLPPLRLSAFSLQYRWFLLVTGVATLGLSSNAFLILRLSDLGLSAAQATLVYTTYNLLYALMAYPLGSLADRVGAKTLVMLGFVTYALVYLGFGLCSAGWQGIVLFLLYALYSAAFEGSSRAYLAQIIPATEKASAIGLYHTLVGLLLLPASALFGALWQHFGSSVAFVPRPPSPPSPWFCFGLTPRPGTVILLSWPLMGHEEAPVNRLRLTRRGDTDAIYERRKSERYRKACPQAR